MSFNINMSNSGEEGIQTIFGKNDDGKSFSLKIDSATQEEKDICDNFISVVGMHSFVSISNSSHNFTLLGYVLVDGVDDDIVNIDYKTLSSSKKAKINAFANLLNSIAI